MATPLKWTDERVEIVRQMAENRKSSGDIAFALKVTRNAVVGVCHRKGIKLGGVATPDQKRAASMKRAASLQLIAIKKSAAIPAGFRPPRSVAPAAYSLTSISRSAPPEGECVQTTGGQGPVVPICIEIVDLERGHCRWPIEQDGKITYCGLPKFEHPKRDVSYCPGHFAIGTVQPRPRGVPGQEVTNTRWKQF